jgi:imidazole glycerol-phosphate synthase subunit HisH
LMASVGREHGDHPGLGWIKGEVVKIAPPSPYANGFKIPHMGWNELHIVKAHPFVANLREGAEAYFVHSYHLCAENPADVLAVTDYGSALTAIVGRDNMIGTQFHPEKSQDVGLGLIGRFLAWRP